MAVAHVVGGLSLDEGRMFRSHLLECLACRARVGELRAIAHDLADVERDERREKAAQRTELKEREREEAELPPPPNTRLNGRATVLVALALVALMALSAWNFHLRGQLQFQESLAIRLRGSVQLLRDGVPWNVVTKGPEPGVPPVVDGHVVTGDDELLILINGLTASGTYRLVLLDADLREIAEDPDIAATEGTLWLYQQERQDLGDVHRIVLERVGQNGSPTVFAAERVETAGPEADEGGDVVADPVGDGAR